MKNNKKKYALVIILILFIAFFSSQCMMTRTNTESKKTVAVILPYTYNKENSRILDAIRDYAHNNSIILDVWHEKSLSSNELSSIIANEEQNHAIGILLIYPENYLTQQEKHSTITIMYWQLPPRCKLPFLTMQPLKTALLQAIFFLFLHR